MRIRRTRDFLDSFNELPLQFQRRAEKAIEQLTTNARHPGLRLEKLKGDSNYWSVRVNLRIRITLTFASEDEIELLDIGGHEVYRR
jgi:plasmid maintenance system killer protein